MKFYLQFGYGMMEHCRSLISDWGGGTAILSPRDLTDKQLHSLAEGINSLPNGQVLLDPQFYLPRADHERLRSHRFWPAEYETGLFFQGAPLTRLLRALHDLNTSIGADQVILPGLVAARVDADWLSIQEMIVDEATTSMLPNSFFPTIALSADALRNEDQISTLIEWANHREVSGYYIVAEHPQGKYFVEDPIWLANLLDLCAALRLRGAKVIIGYCNQQMLIASCAKVTAIASGTWMNVRSFATEKFRAAYEEEIKQRATWYYCPQALSEYKIPFLDVANRLGLLDQMRPHDEMRSHFADSLFTGAQPTAVGFTEQAAFRHFLQCLKVQTNKAETNTFDTTLARHETILTDAESLLRKLRSGGVSGQLRDFADTIDVNRAALNLFANTRGLTLRRQWASIPD